MEMSQAMQNSPPSVKRIFSGSSLIVLEVSMLPEVHNDLMN